MGNMKNTILAAAIIFCSLNSFANLSGKLDLSCKLQRSSPNDVKAELKGPTSAGLYSLQVVEGYFGYQFKNNYRLKKESDLRLSSAKASVQEINKIEGKLLLEVKTDEVGPVTLICE